MNIALLRASLASSVRLSFSRSGGPGGQNVNKVNTKVEARIRLSELAGLTPPELDRARKILAPRLVDEEELLVVSSEERTQGANRLRALARLEAILVGAARLPKLRRATSPTRSSVEKRLKSKRHLGGIKNSRTGRYDSED